MLGHVTLTYLVTQEEANCFDINTIRTTTPYYSRSKFSSAGCNTIYTFGTILDLLRVTSCSFSNADCMIR